MPMLRLRRYYDHKVVAEVDSKIKQLDSGVTDQRVMRVVRRILTMLFRDLVEKLSV